MYHVREKGGKGEGNEKRDGNKNKSYVPYELERRLGSGFSEVSTCTGDVVMVGDWNLVGRIRCLVRPIVPEPNVYQSIQQPRSRGIG